MKPGRHAREWGALALPLFLVPLVACSSGDDDDDSFDVHTASASYAPASDVVVGGRWAVYFADELFTGAAGTDFNSDGDTDDQCAFAVRLSKSGDTSLGVAALAAAIVNDEIYLVVDETEDDVDWDGQNGIGDLVLLHWSMDAGVLTWVDTLAAAMRTLPPVVVEDRVFYAAAADPTGPDGTTLRAVDDALPTTPVEVLNMAGGGTLFCTPLGERDGLLFLACDETEDAVDLNGDADTNDEYVLALYGARDTATRVKVTGVALADEDAPFEADPIGSDDYLVAFLVSEDAQDANLNDQADFTQPLVPNSCAGTPDTDQEDQVLFFLHFQDFLAGTEMPISTGLAGVDRVIAVEDFVATLSPEDDATCDLNDDGDTNDVVARWVEASTPVTPPRDSTQLHAVATSLPGGAHGIAGLSDRFVIVVDEAADDRNLDGSALDHDVVGQLDPTDGFSALWTFEHESSSNPSHGTGIPGRPFAGASWMAPDEEVGRLGIGFQEAVPNTDLNDDGPCLLGQKDRDAIDTLPVWADFEGDVLDFDGLGFALVADNCGIVIARNWAFFRVSESADATDYNGDGDMNDTILGRNPTGTCDPVLMSVSNTEDGPAIATDGDRGGAFLASEFLAGRDLNGDGDTNDLVVRYFEF